ncbi:RAM signaling network component [Friedmanniomyces endolithicus]|uniref:RAM signaling network component n=1 Tax=Friedmanniomyces endolithicus TaxID=329885 RepID=A0AAN6L397_9PEZI|nr:RAM signaling network component [Friedmanniomyces endolithicus]KAK0931310.1 RAM signaling network component [Friedmanniomyces endolithicus]KAK1010459.1 RAM signaling network component [Friedmanniomyces endolithicus]KAK1010896.1 RAM signaling network component [Friedmanniomyces endolithicus]KAK1016239.1 RAM signaling network component [Friedmanniomyces endolithicus]
MASDVALYTDKPAMTVAELVAYARHELDTDAERQAKVSAEGGVGDSQSQTGMTLDLSHKNINALPVEVIVLIRDKVERLALSHNPQVSVPTQIVLCDRLRYLNIRWNSLKQFPEAVLQLTALEILDISKNRIVSIPEGIKNMTSLKFLAVARNKITRLPLALGDMPSLSKLKFDENPIVFPPPDALKPATNSVNASIEAEGERDVCQQVKRFLKAASLRERLRSNSEEYLSESSVETPRPPKRTVTIGRFPVRPSISSIENMDDLKVQSPHDPPPIPQRSHARDTLNNGPPIMRRPGIAPILTSGHDISRSRSETLSSSSSIKSRRQGLVAPKKAQFSLGSGDGNDFSGQTSGRSSQASTIRPSHSRATSSISTLNGFLAASSGGETSSGAVSPIDGVMGRYGSVRRLSSLPENRNSDVQDSTLPRAGKRLLFSLYQLRAPVEEVARALKDGSPKRSYLDRQLFNANRDVDELDRVLSRFDSTYEEHEKGADQSLEKIAFASLAALKAYTLIVKELKQQTRKVVSFTQAVYLRCFMSQIYMVMVESRNTCNILGFKTKPSGPKSTPRVSRAWSSRTVTPTQPKPVNSRRMRGATILRSMSSNGGLRTMPPPVPLNGNTSRTNTMTSLSSQGTATPRSGESFGALHSSILPSRTNTMRSMPDYGDSDEQFDRIYLKLQSACDLARKALPHCRAEFASRKATADSTGHTRAAQHWSLAISKCDAVITANGLLYSRLRVVKVKDPGVRNQRDFWQLCDAFAEVSDFLIPGPYMLTPAQKQSWTDLATEVKSFASQRIDITAVKTVMRPVQKAVKEVSKTISASPLYHQAALRQVGGPTAANTGPPGQPFPTSAHTNAFAQALAHNTGLHSGYATPVPATPLSAALGPAIQATVVSTPNPMQMPPEFVHQQPGLLVHGNRGVHERVDTLMQQSGYGRRFDSQPR